jgi:monoamine oxidase
MQGLTDALHERLEGRAPVWTGAELRSVEEGASGLRLVVDRAGAAEELEARHVVLALPRRALELLPRDAGPLAAPALREAIEGTVAVEAVKVYLGFAEPWWEELGITSGKSVTDLPMHQCLYFGIEEEAPGGTPGDRHALMVATYADAGDVAYWRALAREGGTYAGRVPPPAGLEASEPMIRDVRRQLGEVHGMAVPEPEWAIFVDWGVDPFGAGWHYWRTGASSERIIPAVRRPSPALPLYVCGEAFSARQGWIQGALQTAEHVLRDHLGQPAPEWLDPAADLGP